MDKSYSIDDESDKSGSDSESSGAYSFRDFSLRFDNSAGSISVSGSVVFAPTGVDPKGNIFAFNVFLPTGVDSKGGQLIEMFLRSNYLFYFQI